MVSISSQKSIIILSYYSVLWSVQSIYVPHWQPGENGRVQWALNCDFDGRDLGNFRLGSEYCGGFCFHKPECTRFLWTNENGGTCYFRSGNGTAYYAENGGVCGYVTVDKYIKDGISWMISDENRIRRTANCDFAGLTIDTVRTKDEICGSQCLSRLDCIGFTWSNYRGGICWLKSHGHPILVYTGSVCGEIVGRRASYKPLSGSARKSGLACSEYKAVASHYRINIGELSQRDEFPWMAALGYRLTETDRIEIRCGGTIISDFFVLTAAQCIDPEPEIVQLGTHKRNVGEKTNLLVMICMKHEDFSFETGKNDIGLVRLEQRITFGKRIVPACLRTSNDDLPKNQELVVTGWVLTEDGKYSDTMRKASLYTEELTVCQTAWLVNGSAPKNRISDSQYCAIDPDGEMDACKGYSGGPILMLENSTLATVVGITSFGDPSNLPGIYARVSFYLDWIEDLVWAEY